MNLRLLRLIALTLLSFGGSTVAKRLNEEPEEQEERHLSGGLPDDAKVFKYLGHITNTPSKITDDGDGWTRYQFPKYKWFHRGPTCIVGTPYSVFAKPGDDDSKLLIFLSGGGACWEDSIRCLPFVFGQEPSRFDDLGLGGITDLENADNPFTPDYNFVYLPYCDGSVFTGDNTVYDSDFKEQMQAYIQANYPGLLGHLLSIFVFGNWRRHRGLHNLSAGMELAKSLFPHATDIVVAGSSAGGVGAQAFAPFLARKLFGGGADLRIYNDAGPIMVNLDDTAAVNARANDWQYAKFFPTGCTACGVNEHATELIRWRLENDPTIKEAFYSQDNDATNRGYLNIIDPKDVCTYRELIVTEHGILSDDLTFGDRYSYYVSNGFEHVVLPDERLYDETVGGDKVLDWTNAVITGGPVTDVLATDITATCSV